MRVATLIDGLNQTKPENFLFTLPSSRKWLTWSHNKSALFALERIVESTNEISTRLIQLDPCNIFDVVSWCCLFLFLCLCEGSSIQILLIVCVSIVGSRR
jgi:hypothetical protein